MLVRNHKKARIGILKQWFGMALFTTEHEEELWTPKKTILAAVGTPIQEMDDHAVAMCQFASD